MTASRAAIACAVMRTGGAFTVEDLAGEVRLRDARHSSTATVYRAVAAMAEAGFVERVGTRSGSALFARCNACDHHHHIVCDACGRTIEADCPIGPEFAAGARARGFIVTRHEVTLYGVCSTCSADGPVA